MLRASVGIRGVSGVYAATDRLRAMRNPGREDSVGPTGKLRICDAMRLFLAHWARRLSWRETAAVFEVSWADVYGAVKWVVDYGLHHRCLEGVHALGIDEIHVGRKEKFWTLVYQIDEGCRRLLWVGRDRSTATLERCFEQFGFEFCERIAFVCSDMWKPYLDVAAECLPAALHWFSPKKVDA